MNDLDLLVELFAKAGKPISERVGNRDSIPDVLSKDTDSQERFAVVLPKFRISEKWGKPESQDRAVIEMFTKRIAGNTLQEKLNSLSNFVNECDKACVNSKDVGETLANLVFLESLAAVMDDYNDKTGGFLFESLMVALAGGDAKQIDTKGGPKQDVTDIMVGNTPMSLKFMFDGENKYIKGSVANLARDIVKNKAPMQYLLGLKSRSDDGSVISVSFHQFSIGINDRRSAFYRNLLQQEKMGKLDFDLNSLRGDYDVKSLNSPGLSLKYAKKAHAPFANINLGSRNDLLEVAQRHASKLGENLSGIYQTIERLSNNVNSYFVENNSAAGLAASSDSEELRQRTNKLL